jgi:hypothetical protein
MIKKKKSRVKFDETYWRSNRKDITTPVGATSDKRFAPMETAETEASMLAFISSMNLEFNNRTLMMNIINTTSAAQGLLIDNPFDKSSQTPYYSLHHLIVLFVKESIKENIKN